MLDIIGVQLLDDTLHDGFGSKCSTEKNRMDDSGKLFLFDN